MSAVRLEFRNQNFFKFRKGNSSQKIPNIFAKVEEVTNQHYIIRNSDVSLPCAPHGLGGGDV